MRNKLYKILVLVCLVIVIIIVIALIKYNQPHKDVRRLNPEIEMTSEQLVREFQKDEGAATLVYSEKIIQVNGIISDIKLSNGNSIISIQNNTSEPSVICHMQLEENIKTLKLQEGQQVIIKGKCTGFLLDVILVQCVLINNSYE